MSRSTEDMLLATIRRLEEDVDNLKRHEHTAPDRNRPAPSSGGFDDFILLEIATSAPTITGTGTLDVSDWAITDQGSGSLGWSSGASIDGFVDGGLYSIVAYAQSSGYANGDYAQVLIVDNSLSGVIGGARHVKVAAETNAAPLNASALMVATNSVATVKLQLAAKTASGATVTSFSSSTALAVVRLA